MSRSDVLAVMLAAVAFITIANVLSCWLLLHLLPSLVPRHVREIAGEAFVEYERAMKASRVPPSPSFELPPVATDAELEDDVVRNYRLMVRLRDEQSRRIAIAERLREEGRIEDIGAPAPPRIFGVR